MDFSDAQAIYETFFLKNPIPMFIYDFETLAFLEVNGAAEQQYGYSREEFLNMTVADIRPARAPGVTRSKTARSSLRRSPRTA
jgi:PAS domain S-box-containing protein